MGNLYRFVEPVVLYILERNGPAYGYELSNTLQNHALTDSEIDRGALYRTLKRLETMGFVDSDWDTSRTGPARHIYSITESGRKHLREWAVVMEKLSNSMRSFVEEVKRLDSKQTDPNESPAVD
jgi:poly-beta-hydroxybutyrate-responsive repressor